MKTIKLFALLAAVLSFAACDKDKEAPRHEHDIVYTVAEQTTTTVHLTTEAEWDALLDRFCDYAEGGSSVTFRNAKSANKSATKDAVTFSTTDREAMKRWMAQMEDEGMTVTVTYDPATHTYHGTAYANAPQSQENMKQLSRVTMTKSCGSGQIISRYWRPEYENNYGLHVVYNYGWNGNLLTHVDMDEETIMYMSDGITVDSVLHVHNTAVLTYASGLRTSMYLYDNDSNLVKEFQYIYDDSGRLSQEFQTDHAYNVYNVGSYYYKEFLGLDWYFPPNYLNFVERGTEGLDFFYDSVGDFQHFVRSGYVIPNGIRRFDYYLVWINGDLIHKTSIWDVLIEAYEYDIASQPYGISTGTTSLLPGYNTFLPWKTFWSRHNLTHIYGQGPEMWISHTYNADGTIATAQMTWTDGSTIRWTYEYND